ncbi:hypothetical protein [Nocardia sp. alder85J]|uniref:hypothetical protein n=1 Tax=Nocardia sp. alder85J TaxID=2862949 RepID=UPI001CD22C60|nr:hypothetical protein [Nocardia sp. alder85J]MCX4098377.1 hypothetical protein [Nocardia sp. alder85J]
MTGWPRFSIRSTTIPACSPWRPAIRTDGVQVRTALLLGIHPMTLVSRYDGYER